MPQLSTSWTSSAIATLDADGRRSADTHLIKLNLPALEGVDIYLKDESTHPTGSLKHRLARSLFLYGICNGRIREGVTLVEASSGSTAVSEAYFARLLDLPFIAVLPRSTSGSKVDAIVNQGGRVHFVETATEMYKAAAQLAAELNGHYLDQFTFAERATDWRGNNNIAESIFNQMAAERHSVPAWIVMSAGTGGTSATIGRYIRYRSLATRLCVPDVENSAFYRSWRTRDRSVTASGSRIEGIGRPRVEESFIPDVIDDMVDIPDASSVAAMQVLSRTLGRRVGPSTGTNFAGVCWAANQLRQTGRRGSIVSLICDAGERYSNTYYCDDWLRAQGIAPAMFADGYAAFLSGGRFDDGLITETARRPGAV